MSAYSVVHFFGDNTVEAVPTSWIKGKLCAWPHNKACIIKYIKNKHMPNEIDFKYLKARVLQKNLESLSEARDVADDARYRSDFTNTDEEDILQCKNRNINSPTSSTSSMPIFDDEKSDKNVVIDHQYLSLNVPMKLKRKKSGWSPKKPTKKCDEVEMNKSLTDLFNQSSGSSSYDHHNKDTTEKNSMIRKLSYFEKTSSSPITTRTLTTSTPSSSTNNQNTYNNELHKTDLKSSTLVSSAMENVNSIVVQDNEFQRHINKNLAFLKVELRQIQSNQIIILDRLESMQLQLNDSKHCVENNNMLINTLNDCPLPIDNTADLQTFEDKISGDKDFRTCLVKELSYIGGKHTKAMVRRIMAKLCTDELLQHYSYNGKKGKTPFCSLSICSVIFDAVKKQSKLKNVSQDEIEETIKYVLVQAPFAIKRQLEKKNCQIK